MVTEKKKKKEPSFTITEEEAAKASQIQERAKQPTGSGVNKTFPKQRSGDPITKKTGVETADGRTFLGLTNSDVDKITGAQQGNIGTAGTTAGAQPTMTFQEFNAIRDKQIAAQPENVLQDISAAEQQLDPSSVQREQELQGGAQPLETKGERLTENLAQIGLTPLVAIDETIENLTGIKSTRKGTAAEIAETDAGKLLGLSTLALGTLGLVQAGIVAGGYLGTTTGLTTAAALGAKAASNPVALVVGGFILNNLIRDLSFDAIADRILDRESASSISGAIGRYGARSSMIVEQYKTDPIAGIAVLNQMESDLNILETRLQQAALLDSRLIQSGEYRNILIDAENQRADLQAKRKQLITTIPEVNPNNIAFISEQIKAELEADRQELIDAGVITNDLYFDDFVPKKT